MVVVTLPSLLYFEWDKGNEQKNWLKHTISVKEAEQAFYDVKRLLLEDAKHSDKEIRSILFGKTEKGKMLFIVFTLRKDKVRIISA